MNLLINIFKPNYLQATVYKFKYFDFINDININEY